MPALWSAWSRRAFGPAGRHAGGDPLEIRREQEPHAVSVGLRDARAEGRVRSRPGAAGGAVEARGQPRQVRAVHRHRHQTGA